MEKTEEEKAATKVDWNELLKQSRATVQTDSSSKLNYVQVSSHLPLLKDLLESYNNLLENYEHHLKEEKKETILSIRAALRLALTWTSSDDIDRDKILDEAVIHLAWHQSLLRIVASKIGDAKCRILAAQLLSNLGTSHAKASLAITSYLPLSPSKESATERIRQQITENNEDTTEQVSNKSSGNDELSWVDIMLSCAYAGNREALAGVVAVLHNAIVSMQKGGSDCGNVDPFACQLARNTTLVNTLCRHVISTQSVQPDKTNDMKQEKLESLDDAATEWIYLLLVKCCKLGLLPDLMSSIYGRHENLLLAPELKIAPEHNVLLHCIQSEVEIMSGKKGPNVLGGECGLEALISTHLFLTKLYSRLRKEVKMENLHSVSRGSDEPEDALKVSAIVSAIDILACSLGSDNDDALLVRVKLGSNESTLVQDACNDLGTLMDSVAARNNGKKNRDFIVHDDEKRCMTSLVRLIGNLSFRCRENQDLVRASPVPPRLHVLSPDGGERNGLHVLLSCTSLSHACFTLREWAVIAIRNLLDNNEANQAEVARLEATEAVQSAELESLGIRVNLDPKGNVSVVPSDSASQGK